VLSGAPGIGKTALIDQLCAHATAHDWRVVRALGVQVEPGPPTG
jgi:Ni2+-binding GTPase involved in maturation of urease and hydrogenase